MKINNGYVLHDKVFAPSIPEQVRITNFFNVVNQKISYLKQRRDLLEKYKRAVLEKLLSQELRFKDENGQQFSEWEEKKLRDVAEFRNGKAHEQDISETGGYIVVNSKFISQEGEVRKYSDTQICPLYKNEVVMVMSDVPNGKALAKCFYVDADETYTLNQRICALKATAIEPRLLYYLINRNRYYLLFDSGVGQTNLTKDEVLNCPLFVPSDTREQKKILNFINAIDERIEAVKGEVRTIEKYKKGLLQNMFC